MSNIVIDTNIIIYYIQGQKKAIDVLNRLQKKSIKMYISVITELELFAYIKMSESEKNNINEILDLVEIVTVDTKIARTAGFLKRQNKRLDIADILIAATAKELDIPLLTNNIRDFQSLKGINVLSYKDFN